MSYGPRTEQIGPHWNGPGERRYLKRCVHQQRRRAWRRRRQLDQFDALPQREQHAYYYWAY